MDNLETATPQTSALTSIRAMYLGYYMAIGSYIPYINLYYERLGLSGVRIGLLAAIPVLVASTTTLVWGTIADALRWHRQILWASLLAAPFVVLMLSRARSYTALIAIVVAFALATSPIVPLLDSSALHVASAHNSSYGNIRLWGTLGWSISSWLVGVLIERTTIRVLFYGYILFILLAFFVSLRLHPRQTALQTSLKQGLRRLLLRKDLLLFLLSAFMITLTSGAVMSFFSIFLDGIGAGEGVIGMAWMLAALTEIPVMFYSRSMLQHIGARGLLIVAFATYALRWLLLSFITNPVWVLLLQLLHGFSFAAYLIGGVTYVNERTPEGLSTTAQAVFNVVTFGLASTTGSLVGGYFYDRLGMASLLRILSLIAATGLVMFLLVRDEPTVDGSIEAHSSPG